MQETMQQIGEKKDKKNGAKEFQQRQTAVKTWIKNLVNGVYTAKDGWEPNYIATRKNQKISRANLIGIVVGKSTTDILNYSYIVIDDGSSKIAVRSFDEKDRLLDFNIGDIVNVIGRPREYGKEIFIAPEIVRKIENKKWLEVRKIELMGQENMLFSEGRKDETGGTDKQDEEKYLLKETGKDIVVDEIVETPGSKIVNFIKEADDGNGVDIGEVIKKLNLDDDGPIKSLLLQGDIYEIKPGKVKVLE